MAISTNPVSHDVALDMYREVVMRNIADNFLTTEFGGEFHEHSIIVTPDSFSAVARFGFTNQGVKFWAGTRVKMDRDGNILGVLYI